MDNGLKMKVSRDKRVIRSYRRDPLDLFEDGAPTVVGSRVSESIEKVLRRF